MDSSALFCNQRTSPFVRAVVGGIGVSGVTSQQDGVVAKAGADALK